MKKMKLKDVRVGQSFCNPINGLYYTRISFFGFPDCNGKIPSLTGNWDVILLIPKLEVLAEE